MKTAGLIFPHQLFEDIEWLSGCKNVFLVEEYLFFNQYKFHKQKLCFHRASMKAYEQYLSSQNIKVEYIEAVQDISDIRLLIKEIAENFQIQKLIFVDPTDYWLEKRIKETSEAYQIELIEKENPLFLNSRSDLSVFFKESKTSFFQTTFYKQQRKKLNVLLDENQNPVGGKWSFDHDNRKKFPKSKEAPKVEFPINNRFWNEAKTYVENNFQSNYGEISETFVYPIDFESSKNWFHSFLNSRFDEFGDYEDAIVAQETILNHSLLSPLLNVGLLSVKTVLDESLAYISEKKIPMNSAEGFIRQIIGWREFIRGMYECKGVNSRTRNYWGFDRKIPDSFYTGTTGIEPIDITIKKILKTGYCHHIERLMVLGNFMLLCEFDPDEVYKWFMELFIDAFDWVMVPNVYGMSQFADGGYFATKPYIGGSNYLKKMSNFRTGEWASIWDGLFWRFIHVNMDFFKTNHRTSMLAYSFERMAPEKRVSHLSKAEHFLNNFK